MCVLIIAPIVTINQALLWANASDDGFYKCYSDKRGWSVRSRIYN